MRELAVGIVVGGMIWILPCLFEIRMSPMLLSTVYGINRFEGQRLGNWRPFVFFSTGLELGMWMTASSLVALWLWRCGALTQFSRYPLGTWLLPVLVITTFFCRATGAFALLIVGLMILWLCTKFGSKLLFCALLLVPPLYYTVRIPNYWTGTDLVKFIETYIDHERAGSLGYRFECENLLAKRAMLQPFWGWGGWARNRVFDETGRDIAPTDGLWICYLGSYGCVGLLTWTTMMLLPSWLFMFRFPSRQWRDPTVAPMAAMATLLGLYVIDSLANGFLNLSYVVATGGLVGAVSTPGKKQRPNRNSSHNDEHADLHRMSPLGPDLEDNALATTGRLTNLGTSHGFARSSQWRLAGRYKQLARTLRTQGCASESKQMLVHAYELMNELAVTQPGDEEVQRRRWDCANDLAWLLLNEPDATKGEPLLAVDLAKHATEADAQRATYWNTLGAAYHRTGDPANAISALERSMDLSNGGTGFDYVFLSLAHSQMGQQAEARHWLARTESWIERQGSDQPDLLRLIELARGCLITK
jgi:hypothetical protein